MRHVVGATLVAVVFLGGCGPAAPTLSGGKPVSYWVDALRDPNAYARARKKAVDELGNVGAADPAAFPAVLGALKDDPDPAVRGEAARAVVKFGPKAQEAVPTLENMRDNDPDPATRDLAARALAALQRK
jgi:HEAT repeat protein